MILLVQAFESHVHLNQINQDPKKNKRIISLLKSVQQVLSPYQTQGPRMLKQVLKLCSIDFKFEVATPMPWRKGEQESGQLTSTC